MFHLSFGFIVFFCHARLFRVHLHQFLLKFKLKHSSVHECFWVFVYIFKMGLFFFQSSDLCKWIPNFPLYMHMLLGGTECTHHHCCIFVSGDAMHHLDLHTVTGTCSCEKWKKSFQWWNAKPVHAKKGVAFAGRHIIWNIFFVCWYPPAFIQDEHIWRHE